jgi:hypothetical protein
MMDREIRSSKFEGPSKFGIRNSILLIKLTVLGCLLSGALFGLTGCATTNEADQMNYSERPWNTPRDWETGLPSSINQGR